MQHPKARWVSQPLALVATLPQWPSGKVAPWEEEVAISQLDPVVRFRDGTTEAPWGGSPCQGREQALGSWDSGECRGQAPRTAVYLGEGSVQLDLRWHLKEVNVWIFVVNLLIFKSTNDIFLHRIVEVRKAQGAIDGLLAGCRPELRRTSGPQPQKKGSVTAEPGQ